MAASTFSVTKLDKGKLPSLPFRSLKERVLGKRYELSLVFSDEETSRKLNRKFRKKNKPTNVLSFPLSDNSGELFMHLASIKKDSPLFDMKEKDFVRYIYVHGLLHLKGLDHGPKMESLERRFCIPEKRKISS